MAEGEELYRSWTVDQLKAFLRERRVPLAGNKAELVKKVADIAYTDRLGHSKSYLSFWSPVTFKKDAGGRVIRT